VNFVLLLYDSCMSVGNVTFRGTISIALMIYRNLSAKLSQTVPLYADSVKITLSCTCKICGKSKLSAHNYYNLYENFSVCMYTVELGCIHKMCALYLLQISGHTL
jgi:hypothetical protein